MSHLRSRTIMSAVSLLTLLSSVLPIPEASVRASAASVSVRKGERVRQYTFERNQLLSADADVVPGELIVKFTERSMDLDRASGVVKVRNLAASQGLRVENVIESDNIAVLKVSDPTMTDEVAKALDRRADVEYVEPNYRRHPTDIPTNDTLRSQLWGLDNVGQDVNGLMSASGADINVPEAWTISTGENGGVIVAVIDTGVDYLHPDLAANMWNGSSCVDENGLPLGGCLHGYDFADNDANPLPEIDDSQFPPHGTHVAGTIGAVSNNGEGITGVAPRVKIMALRFGFDVDSEVRAIDFARQNGVKVINASFGGTTFSQAEFDAIQRFTDAGGIFVSSAGNDSLDNDMVHDYPSGYDIDNIVAVAATDQSDSLASFSNFGSTSVDVGAPGVNILSTVPWTQSSPVSENFDALTAPAMPDDWSAEQNWGTRFLGGFFGNMLAADTNVPYLPHGSGAVTLPALDLSQALDAEATFLAACDTEYSLPTWEDYLSIEQSGDGGMTFTEVDRIDEFILDNNFSDSGFSPVRFVHEPIDGSFLTSAFVLRLRWVTNGNTDVGSVGGGCLIDALSVGATVPGQTYAYSNGTSMASPHVAGLAALLMGYNTHLTSGEVKSIILSSGDSLPSLADVTVTGRRINAERALRAADTEAPVITLSGSAAVTLTAGDPYVELGATATDNVDASVTITIDGDAIDTSVAGTGTVTYDAVDRAGNHAVQVARIVTVIPADGGSSSSSSSSSESSESSSSSSSSEGSSSSSSSEESSSSSSASSESSSSSSVSSSESSSSSSESSESSSSSSSESSESSSSSSSSEGSSSSSSSEESSSSSSSSSSSESSDSSSSSSSESSDSSSSSSSESSESSSSSSSEGAVIASNTDSAPAVDQTGGQRNGGHSGNGSNVAIGMIGFLANHHGIRSLPPGAFGGARTGDLTPVELRLVCSIQAKYGESSDGLLTVVANSLAEHLGRSPQYVRALLDDATLCGQISRTTKANPVRPLAAKILFPLAPDGLPTSTNATWNACVRGNATLPLIRSNPDRDERNRGRTCGSYYFGNVWTHPDLHVQFTFVRKPLTISVPQGYVITAEQKVAVR